MATPILMPRPGQMTEECTVGHWHKAAGDPVRRGDVLFEIETDKSTMEVEAFDDGTLLRIDARTGATVPVNTVVAWVGAPGEALPPPARALPESPAAAAGALPEPTAAPTAPAPAPARRVRVSPRARRVAAELRVDATALAGSGPFGRVVERDVRAAATRPPATPQPVPPRTDDDPDAPPPEPLSRLRQVIAARLVESVTTIPQFHVSVAVDMTGVVALRAELRAAGAPVTVTDLIHHAVAQTLVELPLVNARTDGRLLWRRTRVHLGIAVAVPGGLVVPVVRDADLLGPSALHAAAADLVARARAGRLAPDELSGSTFTVSNLGMHGVGAFAAIVNPGESAILAVASILPRPVAIGDALAVRQVMEITLTADHRLVDGELAARFLNAVRRRLEDVGGWRAILAAD